MIHVEFRSWWNHSPRFNHIKSDDSSSGRPSGHLTLVFPGISKLRILDPERPDVRARFVHGLEPAVIGEGETTHCQHMDVLVTNPRDCFGSYIENVAVQVGYFASNDSDVSEGGVGEARQHLVVEPRRRGEHPRGPAGIQLLSMETGVDGRGLNQCAGGRDVCEA